MNIYVGNLAQAVTEEQIRTLFEQYGRVESIKLIKDKFTNVSRGFAFVEMPEENEAKEAMQQLDGYSLAGNALRVNQARSEQGGGSRPQRSGGSRFGGDRRPSSGRPFRSSGSGSSGSGWNR